MRADTVKSMLVFAAALVSVLLVFAARHNSPTRRKIARIWHGRVSWEDTEVNTTMLRPANTTMLRPVNTTMLRTTTFNEAQSDDSISGCASHVMFTTFKCPRCDSLRERIENNTYQTWSTMEGVTFEVISLSNTNEYGVPILGDMFLKMMSKCPNAASYTYINGDIIGREDMVETLEVVRTLGDFLMVGRRTNVAWSESSEFDSAHPDFDFDSHFENGALFTTDAQDYFSVTRNAIDWNAIPPFVIGRLGYDNWLVDHIYHKPKVALVDATQTVAVIHQTDHDGNLAHGGSMARSKEDTQYNIRLIGKGQCYHGRTSHAEWETVRRSGKIVVQNRNKKVVNDVLLNSLGGVGSSRFLSEIQRTTVKSNDPGDKDGFKHRNSDYFQWTPDGIYGLSEQGVLTKFNKIIIVIGEPIHSILSVYRRFKAAHLNKWRRNVHRTQFDKDFDINKIWNMTLGAKGDVLGIQEYLQSWLVKCKEYRSICQVVDTETLYNHADYYAKYAGVKNVARFKAMSYQPTSTRRPNTDENIPSGVLHIYKTLYATAYEDMQHYIRKANYVLGTTTVAPVVETTNTMPPPL